MNEQKKKRIGGSSLARIAGNILSGLAAASGDEFFKIGKDECRHAFELAEVIGEFADAYDSELA